MFCSSIGLFLCALSLPGLLAAQSEKAFLDYSMIHTKFGERIVGTITAENVEEITLIRANDDSVGIQHRNIKRIWHGGEDILVRSDGKFALLNHVNFGVNQSFLGYAQQFRIQVGLQFAEDWYTGIAFGNHLEYNDFGGFPITNFFLRKYFTISNAQRFFAGASYGVSGGAFNNLNNSSTIIQSGNAEIGITFLNRKSTKFELVGGAHVRRRTGRTTGIDINGNFIELESNTIAVAAFLRIGVVFRLFGY